MKHHYRLLACGLATGVLFSSVVRGQVPVAASANLDAKIDVNVEKTIDAVNRLVQTVQRSSVLETRISGCIQSIQKQAKLVVATINLNATPYRYFENKDYAGVVTVGYHLLVVNAVDCRAQYFIPLESLTAQSLSLDPGDLRFRLVVPAPKLDETMIVVPETIDHRWVKGGAGPVSDAKMEATIKEMIQSDIRGEIIKQANSAVMLQNVREIARSVVADVMRKILSSDAVMAKLAWLDVQVVFEDEQK